MPEPTPIVHRGVTLTLRRCRRIQRWIDAHPSISRVALARQVCQWFGWTLPNGELAERSARRLLQRLHDQQLIRLPPSRRASPSRSKTSPSPPACPPAPVPWPDEGPRRRRDSPLLVRPILPSERPAWQALFAQHHYLGFSPPVGEWLGYAAFFDGELVAVAAWGAASLKNRPRDAWIGWDEPTKTRRLSFVVNNTRFLVLPAGQNIPHLASRVLGAMLRRLSRDWQATYRHPLYLAETFVDERRFQGTCYRAANWLRLGTTRGFSRRGRSYQPHGHPKAVWVYPLRPDAIERLQASGPPTPSSSPKETPLVPPGFDPERLPLVGEDGLMDLLHTIPDVRSRQGLRHPLVTVIALAVLAMLCGHCSFEAIAQFAASLPVELRKRLGARRPEPPSEPTFRRVLSRLPADQVDAVITQWIARNALRFNSAIAVDGKTLRGSRDAGSPPVHLLSALLNPQGVVVAQTRVPAKTNEIPCIQSLLEPLPLDGAVVTADALHTQRETARFLVQNKDADYLFFAKDNQPQLRQDIEQFDLSSAFPPSARNR